ncbi:MAG TPA: ATP synthase F0 subunit B [Bryobacteraceae bacterium]|nr:ATP synthase F0 subunit B [Bryobacteraceae bacterium]
MKGLYARLMALACAGAALALPVMAQDVEPKSLDVVTVYKIFNTLLFAAGLGYLIYKYAPAFFNARSADIQKAIQDATGLRIEAEFRSSEIDRKMATLAEEVKAMRTQSNAAMEREHERLRRDADDERKRIEERVQAEIQALRAVGEQEVRRFTASLALKEAEARLRNRSSAGGDARDQEDLFEEFVRLVESGRN